MNKKIFELYIETQLIPQLSMGDVAILDNVAFHKSKRAQKLVRERGAWPRLPERHCIVPKGRPGSPEPYRL